MTLDLFGLIALLIFAVIGFGFVVGSIIVFILCSLPGFKASREVAKIEAEERIEEKLKSLELLKGLGLSEEELNKELKFVEEDPEFIITPIDEEPVKEGEETIETTEAIVEDKPIEIEPAKDVAEVEEPANPKLAGISDIALDKLSAKEIEALEEILKLGK